MPARPLKKGPLRGQKRREKGHLRRCIPNDLTGDHFSAMYSHTTWTGDHFVVAVI